MRTFSSTLRCGNTAEIWNERTTPSRATSAGGSAVMSWPLKTMRPRRRLQELGQQVEAGGLAGAVRTDQRMDGAALDAQADAVHRDEAGELLGQILGFEDDLTHTRKSPSARSAKKDTGFASERAPFLVPAFRGASERASRPQLVGVGQKRTRPGRGRPGRAVETGARGRRGVAHRSQLEKLSSGRPSRCRRSCPTGRTGRRSGSDSRSCRRARRRRAGAAAAIEPATMPAPIRPAPMAQPRPRASAWLGIASVAAIARADRAATNLVLVFMGVSRCYLRAEKPLLQVGRRAGRKGSRPVRQSSKKDDPPGGDRAGQANRRGGKGGGVRADRRFLVDVAADLAGADVVAPGIEVAHPAAAIAAIDVNGLGRGGVHRAGDDPGAEQAGTDRPTTAAGLGSARQRERGGNRERGKGSRQTWSWCSWVASLE